MAKDVFSGNSNYTLDVDGRLVSQSGLTSRIYWRVIVHKVNTTGHRAWGNNGSSGYADGNPGRLWTNNNMEYNFQNGSMTGSFLIEDGYFNVGHDSAGNARYYVSGGMTLALLGSASANTGWRTLPRIQTDTVPPAPDSLGVDSIEMTSMRYRFTSNGDGGASILQWQIGYGTSSTTPQSYLTSGGTSIITGLTPGTTYYFWSRGRNSVGWGPWSVRSTGRTYAGARVKYNGVWREAIPYVKHNGAWKIAQPYSKINGIWRKSI
ncbi:minor tail protein [Arthrobacter phage Truckee]|nr:minor tail protein [Arthrobacter phage Truckee]